MMLTLDQAPMGKPLLIQTIHDPQTAMVAMRLGIAEGETLTITSKVPGGPLVVRRGHVDIALGRDLCKGIGIAIH